MRPSTRRALGTGLLSAATLLAAALIAPPAEAALRCGGRAVTMRGTTGNDVITGTPRGDVIVAFEGNDKIHGLGGDDRICGGAGLDQLLGDGGDDRLYGGLDYRADSSHRRGDILTGGTGNDRLYPGLDTRPISGTALPDIVSWRTSPNPVTLTMATGVATGLGRDTIAGHAYRPELSNQADRVTGTRGDDFISTFAGSDRIWGGAGNDSLFADVVDLSEPLDAAPSSDLVYGQGGRDWLLAREGVDRLYGGAGPDRVNEYGPSGDKIYGGPGEDFIDDVVAGGAHEHLSGDASDVLTIVNFTSDHSPGTLDLPANTTHIDGVAADGYISGFRVFDIPTVFGGGGGPFTARPWTIIGTAAAQQVGASTDFPVTYDAGAGDDRFVDGAGDDSYDGGPGTDSIDGSGGGNDTCTSVEVNPEKCETITP